MDNLADQTQAVMIKSLFGFELSKYKQVKAALDSLVKSNVIKHTKEKLGGGIGSRSRILINIDQKNLMFNIVILQGIFSNTKDITKILDDKTYRKKMAEFAKLILIDKQSVVGVALLKLETLRFIKAFSSDLDLTQHRLPNPFEQLPQLALEGGISVMQALLAQSVSLASGDTMMAHYFNDDIEKAWLIAKSIQVEDAQLQSYISLIERKYQEAKEFDKLLDFLQ